MRQLWTIVLHDGSTIPVPMLGKEEAINAACNLIARGVAVKQAGPITLSHEREIIGEDQLRQIAEDAAHRRASATDGRWVNRSRVPNVQQESTRSQSANPSNGRNINDLTAHDEARAMAGNKPPCQR